ncbi:MAG TPA: NUDIX hydrolase [Acidimicrobiales bacterium]|nr:NUDIX hydrolase [Acidimicrobiales bacterium]
MTRFRKLTEREAFAGHVFRVAVADFESPDGEAFQREIVRHPGAVSVVPVDGSEAILVRQYRAAVDRDLLEIPAGKRDVAGEPPETTARRELEEEIGMRAGRVEELAELYMTPGFSDEVMTIFLASDLETTAVQAHGVEEQYMTIERVALADVPGLIAAGEIADAKSIIGLLLARDRLS